MISEILFCFLIPVRLVARNANHLEISMANDRSWTDLSQDFSLLIDLLQSESLELYLDNELHLFLYSIHRLYSRKTANSKYMAKYKCFDDVRMSLSPFIATIKHRIQALEARKLHYERKSRLKSIFQRLATQKAITSGRPASSASLEYIVETPGSSNSGSEFRDSVRMRRNDRAADWRHRTVAGHEIGAHAPPGIRNSHETDNHRSMANYRSMRNSAPEIQMDERQLGNRELDVIRDELNEDMAVRKDSETITDTDFQDLVEINRFLMGEAGNPAFYHSLPRIASLEHRYFKLRIHCCFFREYTDADYTQKLKEYQLLIRTARNERSLEMKETIKSLEMELLVLLEDSALLAHLDYVDRFFV